MTDFSEQTQALSALDGRYLETSKALRPYFSEAAFLAYRVKVELSWLMRLAQTPPINVKLQIVPPLRHEVERMHRDFNLPAFASRIKDIEKTTNHDTKAVELFLREALKELGANAYVLSHLHFAATSEDINNCAYALMLKGARADVMMPRLHKICSTIAGLASQEADTAMLARTHGQSATPTTLGKEMAVFAARLRQLLTEWEEIPVTAKMNGAVGCYNAHTFAYPSVDWPKLAQQFVETDLGLSFNPLTTQIENHDNLLRHVGLMLRVNAVLIGFCRDIWTYISLGYFKQKLERNEVGSSTMPHKVNPIDFENAEGNFGVANALAHHYLEKLSSSRLQRDLSDSTVMRTLGTFLGHSLVAIAALEKGLSKLDVNRSLIANDLAQHYEVVAEAVQTLMRARGVVDAYEQLKAVSRGEPVDQRIIAALADGCKELSNEDRARIKALEPKTYVGLAATLARSVNH